MALGPPPDSRRPVSIPGVILFSLRFANHFWFTSLQFFTDHQSAPALPTALSVFPAIMPIVKSASARGGELFQGY